MNSSKRTRRNPTRERTEPVNENKAESVAIIHYSVAVNVSEQASIEGLSAFAFEINSPLEFSAINLGLKKAVLEIDLIACRRSVAEFDGLNGAAIK